MVWDAVIACYLFLAGMGAGAFALAALAGLMKPELKKIRRVGYIIAPIAVAVGCLLLMVDAKGGLFNPLRFFFIVSNLQSVMSWGVIILCLFIVVSGIALVLNLMKKETPKAIDIIGLVLAVCTAAYTGVLLGAAPGFPLWNIVVMPLLFIVSATSSGFASVLLVAHATGSEETAALPFLKKTAYILPALEAVLVVVLFVVAMMTQGSGAEAAVASVMNMVAGSYAPVFWVGFVVVGLVAPVAFEVLNARKASSAKGLAVAAEACVLVGAFLLRFLVIMAAVPIFG